MVGRRNPPPLPLPKTENGEYRLNDLCRSNPKYAVISMEGNKNATALNLAKSLLQQGIKDVKFYDDLWKHPSVQARLTANGGGLAPGRVTVPPQPGKPTVLMVRPLPPTKSRPMTVKQELAAMKQEPVSPTPMAPNQNPISAMAELAGSRQNQVRAMTNVAIGLADYAKQQRLVGEMNGLTPKQIPMDPLKIFNSSKNAATQISESLPVQTLLRMANVNPGATLLPTLSTLSHLFSPISSPITSLTPPPKPPLRNNHKTKVEPLPEEFLKCTGCDENIQITKHCLMISHARKHLNIRDFSCRECTFASDSWTVVVAHMKGQHRLENPIPLKNDVEGTSSFNDLLVDLFPKWESQVAKAKEAQMERNKKNSIMNNMAKSHPDAIRLQMQRDLNKMKREEVTTQGRKRKMAKPNKIPQNISIQSEIAPENALETVPVAPQEEVVAKSYRCMSCPPFRFVEANPGLEIMSDGNLVHHLRLHHKEECFLYKCSACEYKHFKESVVRIHIFYRHMEDASTTEVLVTRRPIWREILPKFYPDLITDNLLRENKEELELERIINTPSISDRLINSKLLGIEDPKEEKNEPAMKKIKLEEPEQSPDSGIDTSSVMVMETVNEEEEK